MSDHSKTLGELFWETFEQHLADEQRTMLGPWEDLPDWQRPSIEFAAQAVKQEAIRQFQKVSCHICEECNRNIKAPLFDGCMNGKDCPYGYKPCL